MLRFGWCGLLLSLTSVCVLMLRGVAAQSATQRERALLAVWTECQGCHTQASRQPVQRFEIGLGAWSDTQCVGCHREIDEVAQQLLTGRFDRRRLGLPVRDERLRTMRDDPLPYLDAPLALRMVVGETPRIAPARLGAFLRRPALGGPVEGHADAMMAYPNLGDDEAVQLASPVIGTLNIGQREIAPDRQGAAALWTTHCVHCHGEQTQASGRTAAYLSLFTADWIYAYVNGLTPAQPARKMPIFAIGEAQAHGLYRLFAEERQRLERHVDRAVEERVRLASAPPGVSKAAVSYLFGSFMRDAGCVHCHAIAGRAQDAFASTPDGLIAYVARHGGLALYRRLETRAVEVEYGLGAAQPGMPMTQAPLPEPLRLLILRWALAGCRGPDERSHCDASPDED